MGDYHDTCVPCGDPRSSVALRLRGFARLACADRCLAPLIEELNRVGFRSMMSCCGHGERSAVIVFDPSVVTLRVRPTDGSVGEWPEVDLQGRDFSIEIPAEVLQRFEARRETPYA